MSLLAAKWKKKLGKYEKQTVRVIKFIIAAKLIYYTHTLPIK